jgi:hypothetical protein
MLSGSFEVDPLSRYPDTNQLSFLTGHLNNERHHFEVLDDWWFKWMKGSQRVIQVGSTSKYHNHHLQIISLPGGPICSSCPVAIWQRSLERKG